MALYTQDDLQAVKEALIRIASEGVASATVAGQTYTFQDPEKLERLCRTIQSDLASSSPRMGVGFRKVRPYYE